MALAARLKACPDTNQTFPTTVGLGTLEPRSIWTSWEEADMTKLDFISSPDGLKKKRTGGVKPPVRDLR